MDGAVSKRIILEPEPQRHQPCLMGDSAERQKCNAALLPEFINFGRQIPVACPDLARFGLVLWRQAFDRIGDTAIHKLQIVIRGSRPCVVGKAKFMQRPI